MEAVFDYYDENYYYEMVETKPLDPSLLVDENVYHMRRKRMQLMDELT